MSPMHRVVHRLLLTVALLCALVSPAAAQSLDFPQPADFDSDRTLAHAYHLSETIGDRPGGSVGEQVSAGWLAGQFAALGYDVRIQPFPLHRYGNPLIGMNVIATREGLPGYGVLYAGAHYDTVERISGFDYGGPGANDNASGVGVLLELAQLYAAIPLTPTLTLIAFGGEEDGLAGSRHFVRQLPVGARFLAQGMLNFDCVGVGDELHLYYQGESDREFAEALPVDADQIQRLRSGSSDHVSFSDNGIPAVLFSIYTPGNPCGPHYHRPSDTHDTLERAAIERTGRAAVQALQHLMETATPRSANLRYLPFIAHTTSQ
jgi:hypothetical protein